MSSIAVPYKELFLQFLKDQRGILLTMVINTSLIISYYYLYTDGQTPTTYPVYLMLLVMAFYLTWAWYHYIRYYNQLITAQNDPHYSEAIGSYEDRRSLTCIQVLHNQYLNTISALEKENSQNNHFLYQWIHETKTPVSVIHLIIQKLQERLPEEATYLEEIHQENTKILDNLDKALNTVRLKEFAKDYVPEGISLTELLKEIINDYKTQFIYNKVFPQVKGNQKKRYILSDKKWCRLILEQLITNAIKYSATPDKTTYLHFTIGQDGPYTNLHIRDEGIGIPTYDLPKVFNPFFTGENGRKHKNATGMGLYLSQLTAQKLGHELHIESVVGEGTTAHIRFLTKLSMDV